MNTTAKNLEKYKLANRLVYKKYWSETWRNRKQSLPGCLMPILNAILILYVPPLAIAGVVQKAIDGQTHTIGDFMPYVLLFGGSLLAAEIFMRIGLHLLIRAETTAVNRLYDDGLKLLLKHDLSFFNDNFAGSLTKKTLGYATRYVDIADTFSLDILNKFVPAIFAFIVLCFYSPWLGLCLIFWLVISVFAIFPLIKKRQKLVIVRETASNVISGHIADVYGNVHTIRSHASEKIEEKLNRKYAKDLTNKMRASWDFQNLRIDIVVAPLYIAANISGLLLALYLANQGVIGYTVIIVVFAYFMQVMSFMWEFNHIYRRLESAVSDAAQYTELLLVPPTITDPEKPLMILNPRGEVAFNNVHFQYDENAPQLFSDFSLQVQPGEKIGLVGRSGGGKTSITKLLLRFVNTDQGSITIDGVDINNMTQAHLRSMIAYVPQDPAMFHRSLYDNIAYGKPGSSKEEVYEAARQAHADEFIDSLPDGYDTLVGERGIKLSGGQRQRIAIARAMLRNAPILLLDEATSALDSDSERLIQASLKTLMEGKTAIVIAHRLSTIQHMDRIVVLEKGKIIEQGSHKELLNKKGIYAGLWTHQSGGFLED